MYYIDFKTNNNNLFRRRNVLFTIRYVIHDVRLQTLRTAVTAKSTITTIPS